MTKSTLKTDIRTVRNVDSFNFGANSLSELPPYLEKQRVNSFYTGAGQYVIFLVDEFFADKTWLKGRIGFRDGDWLGFVSTEHEPKTDGIDELTERIIAEDFCTPAAVVGMGGGITMDTAKAVSNLLTNGGRAEDYQGWDLVKVPGIHKIGVPTISGTGAEATRTCVMTNTKTGLKLGMNSDHTVFNHLVLDPNLTATVPRDQYFYTGMDAYIHCMESMAGCYRNAVGDAYSRETTNLCRQIFLGEDMRDPLSSERLMVASYLGGLAIAASYVGVVHPFSAGLSVVLGVHHCVGNCITMRAMEEFYPDYYDEFWEMAHSQDVIIPEGICRDLTDDQYDRLYNATIIHEKPLTNALGENFKDILTREKVEDIFRRM